MKAWLEAHGRGPVEIRPGKTGQFDVVVDGKLVWSRYETRGFPTDGDLGKLFS